jgi:hypothetical protein
MFQMGKPEGGLPPSAPPSYSQATGGVPPASPFTPGPVPGTHHNQHGKIQKYLYSVWNSPFWSLLTKMHQGTFDHIHLLC